MCRLEKDVEEWLLLEENVLLASFWTPTTVEEHVVFIASNHLEYKEEKEKELLNWQIMKVYDEVDDEGQDYISVRWVLTEKEVNEKKIRKARLVARGYEESSEFRRDSPTCSKQSIRVCLLIIASSESMDKDRPWINLLANIRA